MGPPWWLSWERIGLQCRRPRFYPWVGKIPWRREWQPTPVFWPGESHGQRLQSTGSHRVRQYWTAPTLYSSITGVMDCFAKGLCGEAGRDYHLVLSLLLFPIRGPKRRIFLLLFIMTLCSGHLNTATCGEIQKQRHWTRSQDGRLLGFIVSISWHPTSPHGVPSLPPFYAFISQTGQNSATQNHPRTIITSPSPSQPVFTINFSRKMKNIEKLPIGYLFEVKETGGGGNVIS